MTKTFFGCPPPVAATVPVGGGSLGQYSRCRSGLGAAGARVSCFGDGSAPNTAGRGVLRCFGFELRTTEGGQAKKDNFWAVLHPNHARGLDSTERFMNEPDLGLNQPGCSGTDQLRVLGADLRAWRVNTRTLAPICAHFMAKNSTLGARSYLRYQRRSAATSWAQTQPSV